LKLEEANKISNEVIEYLSKHFIRYEIVGSIRRKKEEVKDIDIVAIQKPESEYLFGTETLSQTVSNIDAEGKLSAKNLGKQGAARFLDGESIKRFMFKGVMIDLYLADQTTYETIRLIRTGSADHNIRLTTLARGKGLKLFAGGKGLCKIEIQNGKEIIKEIVDNTEDGILMKLLNKIPRPEDRN